MSCTTMFDVYFLCMYVLIYVEYCLKMYFYRIIKIIRIIIINRNLTNIINCCEFKITAKVDAFIGSMTLSTANNIVCIARRLD